MKHTDNFEIVKLKHVSQQILLIKLDIKSEEKKERKTSSMARKDFAYATHAGNKQQHEKMFSIEIERLRKI